MSFKEISGPLRTCLALTLAVSTLLYVSTRGLAQTIPVHQRESANHGFLVVRDQAGTTIGSGELIQVAHGSRMTARLIFRFKDGSVDDETTEYSQAGTFHVIRDHHIQRGPFFPHPIDASIDMTSQQVRSVALDKGKDSAVVEHMELPEDLSNGIVLVLIKNLQADRKEAKVSYVAFSPKGRVVQLAISDVGQQSFRVGGHSFPVEHYVIKVELGRIAGVIAPIVGKQPSDIDVWVSSGKVPAIVRVDGPLYMGGPVVSIQLANPSW